MTEPPVTTGVGGGHDLADHGGRLAEQFTHLGRELGALRSVDDVLAVVTARAYEAIPAAEHAAISRYRDDGFETVAPTDDLPVRVDQIQYELRSGPCVDAILTDSAFRVGDLATDPTWPEFGRRAAAEHGIHSMLAIRLFVDAAWPPVALNLYASAIDAFDESDQTTATLLATHGALAISAAARLDKIENLERALLTSRRIGMAVGVLMSRYRVTDEQAFNLLRITSQTKHRKLFDVANGVIDTGELVLPPMPEARRR